ncbi:hypothetical protein SRHO_G00181270 [Serrasalmus rhombeus]
MLGWEGPCVVHCPPLSELNWKHAEAPVTVWLPTPLPPSSGSRWLELCLPAEPPQGRSSCVGTAAARASHEGAWRGARDYRGTYR